MAQFATELLAQFVYSLELSYDDLIACEEDLKAKATVFFEQNGGEFIQFEAMGDTLRAQCLFLNYDETLFHQLCEDLLPLINGDIEARLLFVNKDLESLHLYTLTHGKWQECCMMLPVAGPLGHALREEQLEG